MNLLTIPNSFDGEWVIGLSPPPAAEITDWNRRLNLFSGRALTVQALSVEQNGTAGRFALHGQIVSPGVVAGLETVLNKDKKSLAMAAGFGVTASGEDVIVSLPQQSVQLTDIPVYGPTSLLNSLAPPPPAELADRSLGEPLGTLIAKNIAVPKVGILLLQPVVVEAMTNFDATDPCEQDPQNDAFNDSQLVDGARLIYYAWPTEWLSLPAVSATWRNGLAYAIFAREAQAGAGDLLPWEQIGLPVGLLAFDSEWNALFIDRYAVVRQGGKAKPRTPILKKKGNDFLYQARIQQLLGHMVDLDPAHNSASDLGKAFALLPPAGVLPRNALVFGQGPASRVFGTPFFPPSWSVTEIPVPTEQLDSAIQACAPLAPLDTSKPEQVAVLVPVPQIWYEPDLLTVLEVDPVFQQAVDQFSHVRAIWLKRRLDVRASFVALLNSLKGAPAPGAPPPFPDPDPDAVESEDPAATEIDPAIDAFTESESTYGTTQDQNSKTYRVDRIEKLKDFLHAIPGVKSSDPDIDALGVPGTAEVGLEKFITELQAKINAVNDAIDFGFLHAQTDIYRIRQFVLGTDATRLAISPVLSNIAQGQTALATKQDLTNLLAKIRGGAPPAAAPSGLGASGGGGAGGGQAVMAGPNPKNIFVAGSTPLNVGKTASPSSVLTKTASTPASTFKTGAGQLSRGAMLTATGVSASALFGASQATTVDVRQQRPLVGVDYELRTASVGERLKDPAATQAKQFTVASKYTVLSSLIAFAAGPPLSGINLGDMSVPGFVDTVQNVKVEAHKTFAEITPDVLTQVLAGTHDPVPLVGTTAQDEGAFFSAGVRAMENTVVILRLIEGRVQAWQNALDECQAAHQDILNLMDQASRRLKSIADELGKARHDVAFAKGLLSEETARVQGVNDRRDQIVTQQVKFVGYVRPRFAESTRNLQLRPLDPGLTESPIPACLARNLSAPPELRALVNLLREAPLKWFVQILSLLNLLDRIDVLQGVLTSAKLRANFKLFQAPEPDLQTSPGPLGPNILNLYAARRQTITNSRLATLNTDLTNLAGETWENSRQLAAQIVSIGDLIDLGHYHPNVPRVSSQEIENILKVSACLYSDIAAVLPIIRLNWAERLIQVNGPLDLHNLASLPNWAQISILERKEMQAIVDWLFSQVVATEPDAVAHINDIVRLCLLLASHAPVADIIAGSVIRPTPIQVDTRVDLATDLTRVTIGMHVLMYSGSQVVARGVVENLASGQATARVLTTTSSQLTLDVNSKVHFAAPDAFERNPFTAGQLR